MRVESILKSNQPDIFQQMQKKNKHRNKKKRPKKENIDFKRMMEEGNVYKKRNGAYRQVK